MIGIAGLLAIVCAFCCCEFAGSLAARLGVVDTPDQARKDHLQPTPLVGGIALLIPLCLMMLVGAQASPSHATFFITIMLAAVGFWTLGFADDRHHLPPLVRLLVSAGIVVAAGLVDPRFRLEALSFEDSFGNIVLGYAAVPFTVVCVVTLINAVNMADGRNGIVLGMATFWFYGLSQYSSSQLLPIMMPLVVCTTVIMVYNWLGKLFLGDSGTYMIGGVVGLLVVYLHNHPQGGLPEAAGVLWFIVPVLDCARLAVTRLAAGRSPFAADKNHLHHYLSRRLAWRAAFPIYLGLASGPGLLAVIFPSAFLALLVLTPFLYAAVLVWAASGRKSWNAGPAAENPGLLMRYLEGVPTDGSKSALAVIENRCRLLFVVNDSNFFLSHRLPLAIGALAEGYEVHLAAFPNGRLDRLRARGIRFHSLTVDRTGLRPDRDLRLFLQLSRIVRAVKPDLMHCVTIKPVIFGGLAARLLGVPACVTALSGLGQLFESRRMSLRLARAAALPLCRLALGHRNGRTVFQNAHDRRAFVKAGLVAADRTVLVPGSGVDPAVFRVEAEPAGVPLILLPARMLWAKGVLEFVEAARVIKAAGVEARFVLAGAAPAHNRSAVPETMLWEWEEEGTIEWLGHCDDMPALYASSSIVCLPSFYHEGVPKSLIEAAACGRPIITTSTPGCSHICRHDENGLLVPPRDIAALTAAIMRLLSDPVLRRRMGVRGRHIVQVEFQLDLVVNATLAIYRELSGAAIRRPVEPSRPISQGIPSTPTPNT